MLVMVVEDDDDYADVIAHTLRWDQHEIVKLDSVAQASAFITRKQPDLAVIAIDLPDDSGVALCEHMRELFPRLPLVMLGARSGGRDVATALRAGADDYVGKPFHPAELLARVQALLRRTGTDLPRSGSSAQRVSCFGLEVDPRRQVAYLDGVGLSCTPVELEILSQLAQHSGEVLSHSFLTEQVWGYTKVSNATLLKGHISSIRRKIKAAGGDENIIRTLHGHGYCLVSP